ncbi:MAG: HD domain-containing protein [Actinomycetota bacterium]
MEAITKFMYEMGLLKRYKRTGWLIPGVQNPESIAEHMFRSAIIGCLLALMEGADPGKTALLCLFHDIHESRIGDVPSVGRPYITAPSGTDITADQVAGFPSEIAEDIRQLVEDYESATSLEVRLARDAGKLECLLQAREYQAQGYADVPPWIETSAAALQSPSAKRLSEMARRLPPGQWWKAFADAYPNVPARQFPSGDR